MLKHLQFLLGTTALMIMAPDDPNAGGAGGGGDGGKGGDDGKGSSMLDVDKIKNDNKNGGDPAPGDGKPADDPTKKPDDQKPVDQPGQKAARPDWLKDDKFWDAEKGELKADLLYKNLGELQAKFSKGDHKAPAKAEDYKLNLTDEQKATLFGDAKANPADDPYIKGLAAWGVKNGVSQDGLNELLGIYHDLVAPEVAKVQIDVEAEKKQLGANADAIIKNQFEFFSSLYRTGHINDAMLEESKILMETAAGVKLLQAIRSYYGEQPIPVNITGGDGMPTKEELSAMLNDPKYDTDADYRAKVDAHYAKRYGNAPAMSSAQNR